MTIDFTGKTILVTGASGGIGGAICDARKKRRHLYPGIAKSYRQICQIHTK